MAVAKYESYHDYCNFVYNYETKLPIMTLKFINFPRVTQVNWRIRSCESFFSRHQAKFFPRF